MVRGRVILLLQGLFLCAFLLTGAYILSIFQDYSTQVFRENSVLRLHYAVKIVAERLPENPTIKQLEDGTARVAEELDLKLEFLDAIDTDISEATMAYV
ncbi:MAG: hypothetical protein PHV05_11260, partial [Candidatus Riflebacteria bacterium]|nr:hypothetical protein [Candidatus Riflebacteria bacterium]